MIVWQLRQRHVLFSPGHGLLGELPGLTDVGGRSITMPPLPPEEIKGVEAFKAVQVTQLTVTVHLVPFGIDVGVATAAEGFAAATIALDHRRFDAVQSQVLEGVPGACLVGSTGDTPAPVFWPKNQRPTGGLADEASVAVLADAVEGGVTDEGAIIAVDHPDTPGQGVFGGSGAIEPLVLVIDRGALTPTQVTCYLMTLHATTVVEVNELSHRVAR